MDVTGTGRKRYNLRSRSKDQKFSKLSSGTTSADANEVLNPIVSKAMLSELLMTVDKNCSKEAATDEIFRKNESYARQCRKYAEAALYRINHGDRKHVCFLLNLHKTLNFKLVKPGLAGIETVGPALIIHINFEAQENDAPVQTFFAQMRCPRKQVCSNIIVDRCIYVGLSDKLPDVTYVGGCTYCPDYIHHPYGGIRRLLTGCKHDYIAWLSDGMLSDPPLSDSD